MVGDELGGGVRLPASPESVGGARRAVSRALGDWQLDHLTDTAMLLVSELATNVLLHARTDFEVRAERRDGRLRVTVLDCSPRQAVRRRYGLDAGTGRGLGIVEALSAAWGSGSAEAPWAKGVWFELFLEPDAEPEPAEGALYGEDWLDLVDDL